MLVRWAVNQWGKMDWEHPGSLEPLVVHVTLYFVIRTFSTLGNIVLSVLYQ